MSLRRPAKDQPESFEFNASSFEAANDIVAKYPEGKQQSAVMALLLSLIHISEPTRPY